MNVDALVREIAPDPSPRLEDPNSYEAQAILWRATNPATGARIGRPAVRVGFALAALGVAAALGVFVTRTGDTGPAERGGVSAPKTSHSTGPVLQLAAYRLRLPAGYRLLSAAASACPAIGVTFSSPSPAPGGPVTGSAGAADVPRYASEVGIRANAEGGCVAMLLAPPYSPTSSVPDPEEGTAPGDQTVQVGQFTGRVGSSTLVTKSTGSDSTAEWLDVEIPLAGGQVQDLVVSSTGLSQGQLISLVAQGLSITGPTAADTTAAS